jgi:hypothetical protein
MTNRETSLRRTTSRCGAPDHALNRRADPCRQLSPGRRGRLSCTLAGGSAEGIDAVNISA